MFSQLRPPSPASAETNQKLFRGINSPVIISATKVPSRFEVSTATSDILGGAHSNHIISTRDMTSGEIKEIVPQSHASPIALKLADEIKVTFMEFQNYPPDMSPVEIIGPRPQTSNEISSFTSDEIDAASEVVVSIGTQSEIAIAQVSHHKMVLKI